MANSSQKLRSARIYLRVVSLVTSGLGIWLIINPGSLLSVFVNGQLDEMSVFFNRFIGTTLFGYAALNWHASRTNSPPELVKGALSANATTLGLATVVALAGAANGIITRYGWLFVSEHLIFLGGFIYHLITLKAPAKSTGA